MAHPAYLREKARALRVERDLTIDEIAERLKLSRNTIFYWVRDLPLRRARGGAWPESARRRGNATVRNRYRLLRQQAYEGGLLSFDRLAVDPVFRDFVCLYLAEGYKRNRNVVSVCNSDPAVVRLVDRWICRFTRNRVGYSIQYHVDQDLESLSRFWADQLGIDPARIRLQRKSNSGKLAGRTWRSEHGVLEVSVGDTLFRAQLQAWMDRLRDAWV
jgi:hypothetical protein